MSVGVGAKTQRAIAWLNGNVLRWIGLAIWLQLDTERPTNCGLRVGRSPFARRTVEYDHEDTGDGNVLATPRQSGGGADRSRAGGLA